MEKDYSEYELSDSEKRDSVFQNNSAIAYDFLQSNIRFIHPSKLVLINVNRLNEFHSMKTLIDEFELSEETRREIHPEILTKEDIEDAEDMRISGLKENQEYFEKFSKKFKIDTTQFDYYKNIFYEENPDIKVKPLNNVLSGSDITLEFGAGILDFLYADFLTPTKKIGALYQALESLKTPSDRIEEPGKIYCQNDIIVDEYFKYLLTMSVIDEIAYSSLYSAICPPVFLKEHNVWQCLNYYIKYLMNLQKYYQELFEFCFDETFYPSVLGYLCPAERYYVYKNLNNESLKSYRTEVFALIHLEMSGRELPYGLPHKEVIKRMGMHDEITDEQMEFANKYNISAKKIKGFLKLPHFVNIKYDVSSVKEILELEFTKLLEYNIHFRKCKRCGQYFIMKGNYDTNYCDRVADGETRNCQQIASQENYKNKVSDNKAIPIYSKYYKRYSARVKVNQIKETDFKKWKYEAITKRDECSDGKITSEEYIKWMEDSFPNRKPKK